MSMAYFSLCIFLSAFLLFQIQPMIGKTILPWFGGTPTVWSTVMLFFQVLLTGGYAYAAWLTGKTRRRGLVHLALLGLSLILMLGLGLAWKSPITPGASLKPGGTTSPVADIFKILTLSVGLPYFLLASNSPLIQTWLHRAFPERTAYRLYALSNAASLVALVSYPVLVEPYLSLPWQGRLWSVGYIAFAGLAAYGAVKSMRGWQAAGFTVSAQLNGTGAPPPVAASLDSTPAPGPAAADAGWRPTSKDHLMWIALSACPSILLLATTSYLTQQVAVIPFLWVLPLTIYLLTFVLAFSGGRWYSRQVYSILFIILILLYDWALANSSSLGLPWQIGIFSLVLFFGCMICHGELYNLRPHPQRLPSFYLTVSAGGAIGGMLINFVAPYTFQGFWELPLGYVLCCVLFLIVVTKTKMPSRSQLLSRISNALLITAVLITSIRAILFIGADLTGSLSSQRNFYGVVRVRQLGSPGDPTYSYELVHGNTVHGAQFLATGKRDVPTAYYGPRSGVGVAILHYPRRAPGMRVGVLGLGTGTIASYGQPDDIYRFYEINPLVIQLAEGQGGYFTFLKDSRAQVEVVPGDARLSLERELAEGRPQQYDVLALDVFSNDSIPVHLLDEEAFALYLQHLQPEGILAVHITNGYLDLVPVVWTLADHFNLSRVLIEDPGDGLYTRPSTWMLLSRDSAVLNAPAITSRATPMAGYTPSIHLWTDEYSNLFQIMKH